MNRSQDVFLSVYSDQDWLEVYDYECKEECTGEINISIWHIDYWISNEGELVHMNITIPSAPEFLLL